MKQTCAYLVDLTGPAAGSNIYCFTPTYWSSYKSIPSNCLYAEYELLQQKTFCTVLLNFLGVRQALVGSEWTPKSSPCNCVLCAFWARFEALRARTKFCYCCCWRRVLALNGIKSPPKCTQHTSILVHSELKVGKLYFPMPTIAVF